MVFLFCNQKSMIKISDLRLSIFHVCLCPLQNLKKWFPFPRYKPSSFKTTYTSGSNFPFDISSYKRSVEIGKSRGDPVLCPYLTPWYGGHFLMTVSVLTAGRPPGVNKGWTERETMPRPYAESLPLVKDRRVSARQVKSRRLKRRRACWYLNNKPLKRHKPETEDPLWHMEFPKSYLLNIHHM